MAICREKRGGRVYLVEYKSVREGDKIKHKFVRYLGREGADGKPIKTSKHVLSKVKRQLSLRAGDVTLLWRLAQDLDFIETIDRFCCGESSIEGPSPGKFLTIWAINRILDPESCTQLERWVKTTELPNLSGIKKELFTKDAFLTALDFVCYYDTTSRNCIDHTAVIDETLYQIWRNKHLLPHGQKETIAYDLTSVLFFGMSCPLAELGYNAKGIKRRQVNLALLVSGYDKHPITHFVYNGSRNSSSTVKNLLARLIDTSLDAGTIIWDRGNVSKEHVKMVEGTEWKLICGIPKTSKDALSILRNTEISPSPLSFVRKSKSGSIYAKKVKCKLFDRERDVVVYTNQKRKISETDTRNEALFDIGKELELLNEKGGDWSEKKLHGAVKSIVGDYEDYIWTRVSRKKDDSRVKWGYKKRELGKADNMDGKYLLYSTDGSLAARTVVNTYLEKDFIEKVFRVFKSKEEIEPVRHRLETRVKGIIFICVLAYRLLSALQWNLNVAQSDGEDISWERAERLLMVLSRVERMEVMYGKQRQVWYLNVVDEIKKSMKLLGYPGLFDDSNVESADV